MTLFVNCFEHLRSCSETKFQLMFLFFENCVRSLKSVLSLINLINSLITHYITHTCNLRITFARKSFKSINFAIQLRVTWMISLLQCFRRCDLTKNIKNLLEICGFCSLTSSCLNFKLFVNTLTFCDCIRLFEAMR